MATYFLKGKLALFLQLTVLKIGKVCKGGKGQAI